jgi:hypothetical protein
VGRPGQRGGERAADGGRGDAEPGEDGRDDPAVLLEQHGEQVLGDDLRVARLLGQAAGVADGLGGLDGEAIWFMKSQSWD